MACRWPVQEQYVVRVSLKHRHGVHLKSRGRIRAGWSDRQDSRRAHRARRRVSAIRPFGVAGLGRRHVDDRRLVRPLVPGRDVCCRAS